MESSAIERCSRTRETSRTIRKFMRRLPRCKSLVPGSWSLVRPWSLVRRREPNLRDPQAVERVDAHRASLELDGVAEAGPPTQASHHVAPDSGVSVPVDVEPELLVDIRHQSQSVDFRG